MNGYSFFDDNSRQTEAQRKVTRQCRGEHRPWWRVAMRNGNASAFSGYRWTPSAYSEVRCTKPGCQRPPWRTRAAYVSALPDMQQAPAKARER